MTFEEAYNLYSKLVYNLALQYVQNSEDAEEITQDVYVAVYKSLPSFHQKAELKTWIYRIAINKSLDFIKAKNRKKRFAIITSIFNESSLEIKNLTQEFNHPGLLMEQKEELEILFNHINLLPSNQKTALILSKIEQKTQQEIAEIMRLSIKAVESLLQRAKTSLATKLKSNEGKKL